MKERNKDIYRKNLRPWRRLQKNVNLNEKRKENELEMSLI